MMDFAQPFAMPFAPGLGVAVGGQSYESFLAPYVANSTLPLWLKFRETSGTNAANSGSAGATLDGTIAGTTALGQTGALGANEAYDYDGLTSKITVAASALLNLPAFTAAILTRPDTAGESSIGRFFNFADSGSARFSFQLAITALGAAVASTGAATSITTTGLTAGVWAWLFLTYDDAGDRLIRIYKGVGGSVTEYAYGTQTAATGTRTSMAGNALIIGNRASSDQTFDGLYDEFQMHTVVRDTAWMTQLVQLTGV